MHVLNEGAEIDTGLVVVKEEQEDEEKGEPKEGGLLEEQSTVTMTDEETVRITTPDREIGKEGLGLSEFGRSPLGSFQLIQSSQSSEIDKMIPYVPPLKEMKILQFEDTLSEEDHTNFNLKAGNLTDLTLGIVIAKKPPTWLQVMH